MLSFLMYHAINFRDKLELTFLNTRSTIKHIESNATG